MTKEHDNIRNSERRQEQQARGDAAPAGSPITDKGDNALQDKIKVSDALKAFRFTKDGQNSFTIVDEKTEVSDRRPLRTDASVVQSSDIVVAPSSNSPDFTNTIQRLTEAINNSAAPVLDMNLESFVQNKHPGDSGYDTTVSPSGAHHSVPSDGGSYGRPEKSTSDSSHRQWSPKDVGDETQKGPVSATEARLNDWADKHIADIEHKLNDKNAHLTPRERRHLEKEENQLKEFKNDLRHLKSRPEHGLYKPEVEAVLQQIDRLTTAKGETPMPSIDRLHVAEQIMHMSAYPAEVCQGNHKTCNVAVVESRLYERTPSVVAKLVADICLTDHYRNEKVDLHFHPSKDTEANIFPPRNGRRTYASEIFQVAAVNVFHQVQKDGLEYVQQGGHLTGKETGELTINTKTRKPAVDEAGNVIREPNLASADIGAVYDAIIGLPQGPIVLVNADNLDGHKDSKAGSHVSIISNEVSLEQSLIAAKSQHALPLILKVNTDCDPFYKDSDRHVHPGQAEPHVVTITDFTVDKNGHITGVCIDNQWRIQGDHDKNNPVSLHDLYIATMNSKDAIAALKADVDAARREHKTDYGKEMELVRLELLQSPHDANVQKDARRLAQELIEHWIDLPPSQGLNLGDDLMSMLSAMPAKDRIDLLDKARRTTLVSDYDYENVLVSIGQDLADKKAHGHPDLATAEILEAAINRLPKQMQKKIRDFIKNGNPRDD